MFDNFCTQVALKTPCTQIGCTQLGRPQKCLHVLGKENVEVVKKVISGVNNTLIIPMPM